MGGRKHRERLRKNGRMLLSRFKAVRTWCLNCGEEITVTGGHYVPPGAGDKGFFYCKSQRKAEGS